jgi:hypothetical protein
MLVVQDTGHRSYSWTIVALQARIEPKRELVLVAESMLTGAIRHTGY